MHDVVNGTCSKNICRLFASVRDTHPYNTGSAAADKLCALSALLNTQDNSFSLSLAFG